MHRLRRLLILVPLWMFAAWGSLQIHTLDLHLGHSICGPWGCGPPTEALIGYQAFWAVLLLPVVVSIACYASPWMNRAVGTGLFVLGLLMIAATAGRSTYAMWTQSGSTYVVQKFLFAIATNVDIPMIQTLLAGCGLAWYGRTSARTAKGSAATGTAEEFATHTASAHAVPPQTDTASPFQERIHGAEGPTR